MHVDEVLCHGENGRATWETSHRDCIIRKVTSKEFTAGGSFDFFLDSSPFYLSDVYNRHVRRWSCTMPVSTQRHYTFLYWKLEYSI